MQIGILGGTFDPIHLGHLILADQVREAAGLERIWFVPSYQPPHKDRDDITAFPHRVAMVQRAIADHAAFHVDTIELYLPPPSYTAHTLAALRQRHPDTTFHLIVGADCLPDLPKWYEPRRILEQAELLAVPRPGTPLWSREQLAEALSLPVDAVRLRFVECPLMEIASRDLRARIAAGRSVRYLIPDAVQAYIRKYQIYRAPA